MLNLARSVTGNSWNQSAYDDDGICQPFLWRASITCNLLMNTSGRTGFLKQNAPALAFGGLLHRYHRPSASSPRHRRVAPAQLLARGVFKKYFQGWSILLRFEKASAFIKDDHGETASSGMGIKLC